LLFTRKLKTSRKNVKNNVFLMNPPSAPRILKIANKNAGSCSALARTIRLNSELAKKPRECLEYIVVHEMVHLLERTHNRRFISLMEQFMPRWQSHRELLNRLPVRREKWVY
jgi:predicted metal-dependent hydrolase